MSLYNMLHGENQNAQLLLAALKLDEGDFGRYRDAYPDATGDQIIVFARIGGGNREDYDQVFDSLRDHPYYVHDWDDDFDSTYAYIAFTTPPEHLDGVRSIATGAPPETVHQKFQAVIEALQVEQRREPT